MNSDLELRDLVRDMFYETAQGSSGTVYVDSSGYKFKISRGVLMLAERAYDDKKSKLGTSQTDISKHTGCLRDYAS